MTRFLRFLVAFLLACATQASFASATGLVVSQVYGGGGNSGAAYKNDFIEVFNAGTTSRSLTGLSVQYASSTGTSWQVTTLSGVLQPGQYYLVQESVGGGGTVNLPTPDATGTLALSATMGKVALVNGTTALSGAAPTVNVLDIVSFGAMSTVTEGPPVPTLSNTTAALRNTQGCVDTDNNAADFTVGAPSPRNTASPINLCGANAPIVTACANFTVLAGSGGSGNETASDVDSTVNAATLSTTTPGITLGTVTPAAGPGTAGTAQVLVSSAVGVGSYPFTLSFANDQAQTAMCTAQVRVAALTRIFTIQGAGSTSPLVGQSVITQGVVTRVTNAGFYMQDATGDGDATTSDGIYVFTSTTPTVKANDLARVSATVTEFNVGLATNTDTTSHTVTELSSVASVAVVGSGSIVPVVIAFPFSDRDQMEAYEGMLVTINGPLTVAQNYYLGQYGQLTIAALGAVETPTNRYRPGATAQALYADNKRRSLVLEDGTSAQNPNPTPFFAADNTVRQGDTVTSITGVVDYGLVSTSSDPGAWRIIPTVTPQFTRANVRTTAPDDVGGTIRVASANVDNFFTTFTNGQTADGQTGQGCTVGSSTSAGNCRGADSLTEFTRQRAKIVEELVGLNADVIGIMELQNNGPTAIGNLVDAINARIGSPVYAAVPDPAQGTGTDAIKVGMIYKPAKVTRSGASVSDPAPIHNRAPLAQAFLVPGGQTFTLVVNHLRSKGCSGATGLDADQGDLQSCFNDTRRKQGAATRTFVSSLFPAGATPNVLLVGDFNAYAMEDPVADMTAAGYTDELGRFNTFGYSYQFDGSSGRIDQALSSPALSSKVKRALEWHVNADEPSILDYNLEFKQPACATCEPDYYTATPYRASDHDPLVVGISFGSAPPPKPTK